MCRFFETTVCNTKIPKSEAKASVSVALHTEVKIYYSSATTKSISNSYRQFDHTVYLHVELKRKTLTS